MKHSRTESILISARTMSHGRNRPRRSQECVQKGEGSRGLGRDDRSKHALRDLPRSGRPDARDFLTSAAFLRRLPASGVDNFHPGTE